MLNEFFQCELNNYGLFIVSAIIKEIESSTQQNDSNIDSMVSVFFLWKGEERKNDS